MTPMNFKPFAVAGLFWAALSMTTLAIFSAQPQKDLFYFFIPFFLVCFDLFFLGKTVAVLSDLLSDQLAEKRTDSFLYLALWGSGKMIALCALVAVIWKMKHIPALPLFLGLGTLVVTPFLGGLGWSWLEEFKKERTRELDHAR